MQSNDLLKVYNSIIRPAIEYSATVYHSMISEELSGKLEGMQQHAMRIIYGWNGDIRETMEAKGIEDLKDRREEILLRFALKNEETKFGKRWFKRTEETGREVRDSTRKKYKEQMCRTERLRRNPVNYMVRKLNEHYSK